MYVPAHPIGGTMNLQPTKHFDESASWLNPANAVTVLRLVLVPIVIWQIEAGNYGWAMFWLTVAVISDRIDGDFARLFNCSTPFGAELDATVDRIMGLSVMIYILRLFEPDLLWLVIAYIVVDVYTAFVAGLLKFKKHKLYTHSLGRVGICFRAAAIYGFLVVTFWPHTKNYGVGVLSAVFWTVGMMMGLFVAYIYTRVAKQKLGTV